MIYDKAVCRMLILINPVDTHFLFFVSFMYLLFWIPVVTKIALKFLCGKLSGNVLYDTVGSSLDIVESDDIVIENNLAALAHKRVETPNHEVFEALGNFMVCMFDVNLNKATRQCNGVLLRGNVAAGSHHISFGVTVRSNAP